MDSIVLKWLKSLWLFLTIVLIVGFIWSVTPTIAKAEDNSSTVPGNPAYTDDAFYYSDQYMWKVSLFVAKSDTVNKETSTMDDFHRIGSHAVYLTPVSNWNDWYAGSRPSNISGLYFSKENKVDTLNELKSKGGNVNALDPVELATANGVYVLNPTNTPKYVPQLNDGDVYDNGVIYKDCMNTITDVTKYFNDPSTMFDLLNFYAGKQGISKEALIQNLEFTIDGETRTGWNPEGILPKVISDNPTNQVEWLIVYEPVSIVYVKNTANPGSYYGYALTATDFAVSQIKHQMDWLYDETRWPAWTGLQADAWKANANRQHVSRLSHLLMGNSVLTKNTWYGLKAGTGVDQNAAIPNNRWTSANEIKYGGWGMTRWLKPAEFGKPTGNDYRPNTDVIITTPVYSNIDTTPGSELTVTYEINGETFTDKIISPMKTESLSYFKWHSPDVDVETEYDLKISVSPYPKGTLNNGGNEYTHRKIIVRPLVANNPPDPKVGDKMPIDLPADIIIPTIIDSEDKAYEGQTALIKSVTEITQAPHYLNASIVLEVVTNRATKNLSFNNLDTGEGKQLTIESLGSGILAKYTLNELSDEITWQLEFTPKGLGINHYSFTPNNALNGAGNAYAYNADVLSDLYNPVINSISISQPDAAYTEHGIYTQYQEATITIMTDKNVDQIDVTSPQGNKTLTPYTEYSDEDIHGDDQSMDMNNDSLIDQTDYNILKAHIDGSCENFTAKVPCTHCGAKDLTGDNKIDNRDLTAMQKHLDGDCAMDNCYFHGKQVTRTEVGNEYQWKIRWIPRIDGESTLAFTPKRLAMTSDIYTGKTKSLTLTAEEYKNPVIITAGLDPDLDKYMINSTIKLYAVTPLETDQMVFKTSKGTFIIKSPDTIDLTKKEKVWSKSFNADKAGSETFALTGQGEQSTGYLSGETVSFTANIVNPQVLILNYHSTEHEWTYTDGEGNVIAYVYDSVAVTATANADTDYIIFKTPNGEYVTEDSYYVSGGNRIFTTSFTVESEGSITTMATAYSTAGAGNNLYKTLITETMVNTISIGQAYTVPTSGFLPGATVAMNPSVSNVKNVPCYVRVKAVISNSNVKDCLDINFDTASWTYNISDGYYYYNSAINPQGMTTPLFTHITVKGEAEMTEIQKELFNDFDEDMIIYAESVQAESFDTAAKAFSAVN